MMYIWLSIYDSCSTKHQQKKKNKNIRDNDDNKVKPNVDNMHDIYMAHVNTQTEEPETVYYM